MPGMKLQFIKNAPQRVASSRPLPLKQVEAIILYGKPEQHAKVVEKILPNAYGLALNQTTHYLLLSLIDKCATVDRVKLLYSIRRKILDLSISPVGNKVIQKLVELLPKRQRTEIAECFTLNVEDDEFKKLCIHPFGNHVAQKMMEINECVEVLESSFLKVLPALCSHEYGMRVVDTYIQSTDKGWKNVVEVIFGIDSDLLVMTEEGQEGVLPDQISKDLDMALNKLFQRSSESMVICSLLRHPLTPLALKDAICAHLSAMAPQYLTPKNAALQSFKAGKPDNSTKAKKSCKEEEAFGIPDFGTEESRQQQKKVHTAATDSENDKVDNPRHVHTFREMLEYGSNVHRQLLWNALSSKNEEGEMDAISASCASSAIVEKLISDKRVVSIAVAAVHFYEPSRRVLLNAILQRPSPTTPSNKEETLTKANGKEKVAPARTLAEVAQDAVATHILRALIEEDVSLFDEGKLATLIGKDVTSLLAKNPVSSPVLQRLIEADSTGKIASRVFRAIQSDLSGLVFDTSATYVVQLLLSSADAGRKMEWSKIIFKALGTLKDALSYSQGSHVLQKVISCMDDNAVRGVVRELLQSSRDEEDAEMKNAENLNDRSKKSVEAVESESSSDESDRSIATEEEKNAGPLSSKTKRELNKKKHYSISSNAIISYATHSHACFVIQALIMETRNRQLEEERRLLMNELKPFVFELAISPWAGRVVLDAMLVAGSAELKASIKNVVFLKAESWLTERGGSGKHKSGDHKSVDPTIRHILKRQRDTSKGDAEKKKASISTDGQLSTPPLKKRKLHQRIKK